MTVVIPSAIAVEIARAADVAAAVAMYVTVIVSGSSLKGAAMSGESGIESYASIGRSCGSATGAAKAPLKSRAAAIYEYLMLRARTVRES
jgi:hypothetical protein